MEQAVEMKSKGSRLNCCGGPENQLLVQPHCGVCWTVSSPGEESHR